MEIEAGALAAGVPSPADIRSRLVRGRPLIIALGETVTMPAATAAARALRTALRPDVAVFASHGGGGPSLTVLQLVSDAEVAAVRPALDRLVAEFREVANALVGSGLDGDGPEYVRHHDATWSLYRHGEHCRFENTASGEVVEAHVHAPDSLDPYFLLEYAETSGRHGAVVGACVEGFHDMCRLLDATYPGPNR
jgi:hypothetical protein